MTRTAHRAVVAGLGVALLLATGCGDDAGRVATAPSPSSAAPPSTAGPAGAVTSTSPTTGAFGPGPLVPGSGQAWTDLYPDGQPPVFPLPNSSRAFPAAPAAAIGFAREFLGMTDPQISVEQQSDREAQLLVRPPTGGGTTRLALRRDDLGWVVVSVDGDGVSTGLPAAGAAEPVSVDRTIDLSGASADAGAMVDVVDLADGRVVARQPVEGGSVRLGSPAPELAAVVVYVPEGGTAVPGDLSAPRRAQVASVAAVHVLPG